MKNEGITGNKILLFFLFIMLPLSIYSQNKGEKMLVSGWVTPISYQINGVEQIDSITCMYVDEDARYNSYFNDYTYRVIMKYHNGRSERFEWTVPSEKIVEKQWTIDTIVMWQANEENDESEGEGVFFSNSWGDEIVSGKLNIDMERNIVTLEITYPKEKSILIIWENLINPIQNYQVFIKIGEEWSIEVENDEEHKWRLDVNPGKGFSLIRQRAVPTISFEVDHGSWVEIFPGKENAATEFVFLAQKIGKYILTFDNSIRRYTMKVIIKQ